MLATEAEAAILKRVLAPEEGGFPTEAARQILNLGFTEADHARMADLSTKAQVGTLTTGEREELEGFINVSHLIALLQSKARMSLKKQGFAA
jgi:hypothetical protein